MPHYAAIEPDGNGLMIVSYKSFTFVPVGQDVEEKKDEDMSDKIKGNFTFHLHTVHVYLYVCICLSSLSALIGYRFYQVKIVLNYFFFIFFYISQNNLCKIYHLNSGN